MSVDPEVLEEVFWCFGGFFSKLFYLVNNMFLFFSIVLLVGIFKIFRKNWTILQYFRMLHAFFLITLKVASSREPCTIETMLLLYLYALRLVMNVSVETNWGKRKRTASVRRLVPETRNRFVVAAGDLRSTKTQNLSHVSSLIGRV